MGVRGVGVVGVSLLLIVAAQGPAAALAPETRTARTTGLTAAADIETITARAVAAAAAPPAAAPRTPALAAALAIDRAVSPSGPVALGDRLRYTLTVRNPGGLALTEVTVTDPLPRGTAYVPGSAAVDGQVIPVPADGSPLAEGLVVGRLLPGARTTLTYVVVVGPGSSRAVGRATVRGTAPAGPLAAVTSNPTVTPVVLPPDRRAEVRRHSGGSLTGGAGFPAAGGDRPVGGGRPPVGPGVARYGTASVAAMLVAAGAALLGRSLRRAAR